MFRSYRSFRIFVPSLVIVFAFHSFFQIEEFKETRGRLSRMLLTHSNDSLEMPILEDTTGGDDALFPTDLFTDSQLAHGAVILHIIGIIYMFYALALVCDEYFVPSLDVISDKLGISPDVAGATFMAAGGSAPELFTSIIGVFIAKTDVGIGTIVGSAVFNILFVIAVCAFAAKTALSLTAWPLIRDVTFYSTSLILLVLFFADESIEWWEALILFLIYGAYVAFMAINQKVENGLRALFHLEKVEHEGEEGGVTLRKAACRKGLYHLMNETINKDILEKKRQEREKADGEEMVPLKQVGGGGGGIMILSNSGGTGDSSSTGIAQLKTHLRDGIPEEYSSVNTENSSSKKKEDSEEDSETKEDEPIDMTFPTSEGWKKIAIYIVSFPIMGPLYLTLPDTKRSEKRKYFVVTFCLSIVWIAVYSYLMVWWATVAGKTIGISPPVMGLTFLAAGTSVPDLITSVLVAQQGKGDMAVSSSVGSNIFDVTVGLPFPWLLYTIIFQESVKVSSVGVGCSITMLFLMLVVVFVSVIAFNWKMTKGMGVVMMILYVVFVGVSLGFSYDLYTCPM